MTPAELVASVRLNTRTDATTLSNADFLIWLNDRIDDVATDILEADERILLIPQTDGLVEDQREYAEPSDILSRLTRVEAKFDGTNWVKLEEKAITDISHPLVEANIVNNYANLEGEAFFYIARKAINILSGSISTVASGLKMWVDTWPAHKTDATDTVDISVDPSTTTHGIPRALHQLLKMGIIIDYKSSREKPIPLTEREGQYDKIKKKAIATLKKAYMDRDIIGWLPPASERWDDGANL